MYRLQVASTNIIKRLKKMVYIHVHVRTYTTYVYCNPEFHPICLQHCIEPPERYRRNMRERFIAIRRAISVAAARFIRSPRSTLSLLPTI